MHILVTGGAGFIGSHVTDHLIERGHDVRVVDALVSQVHGGRQHYPTYLNPRAELLIGRMETPGTVEKALENIDSVIHLASAVGVGQSMYEIVDYCNTNIMGTARLLQTIIDSKRALRSLVVASSMSAYGEGRYRTTDGTLVSPKLRPERQLALGLWEILSEKGETLLPLPTDEEKPLSPSSVYAINKRDQEEMCLSIGATYAIPTTALRFFNVYGSRQALSNPYTGVAAIFCARLLNARPPLVFEDGQQMRDFVHVQDVARAVVATVERPVAGEAINIGSGESVSVLQVAEALAREMNKDIEPKIIGKYRNGDIRHCFADIRKAKHLLDWKPTIPFCRGIPELIDWVRCQRVAEDRVDSAYGELEQRGLLV
jgi:dTDP-L-rhamnose 4-epimerase